MYRWGPRAEASVPRQQVLALVAEVLYVNRTNDSSIIIIHVVNKTMCGYLISKGAGLSVTVYPSCPQLHGNSVSRWEKQFAHMM